jgi:hypothetical protein
MPKLSTLLDQIDSGAIALPEFQRGYVWNREQVRRLMRSLYRAYPVGAFLMWETQAETAATRSDTGASVGVIRLLLDGQQRITSLYGIIRGKPPRFFDGDLKTFTGLYFNLDLEEFEFHAPKKMDNNPFWINVSELMQIGAGKFAARILRNSELADKTDIYLDRLNAIDQIKDRDFHIETITGVSRTLDEVVEVFNEVNSGGKKLSKADLALAKVCASWSQARDEMKLRLENWHQAGFSFKLDWLMRCITTTFTGEAYFHALEGITAAEFQRALYKTERHIDTVLHLIGGRLGLDYDRVLGSRYSIPLLVRYIELKGGRITDPSERDRLLYWYVHTFLWGRYAGSTESTLAADLNTLKNSNAFALDELINGLRRDRGDLKLSETDFAGWSLSNRFYPLLYMLTRVWHAKDWQSGVDLTNHSLGRYSNLQVHHIFPKKRLYAAGYSTPQVNAVANFTFLTQDTNLVVSDRDPSEYLAEFAARHPNLIASHWIPLNPELWQIENYPYFLAERRQLLANAANEFLESLLAGAIPHTEGSIPAPTQPTVISPGSIDSDEELKLLEETKTWVEDQGLSIDGEIGFELLEEGTNNVLATLDLAWINDLQDRGNNPVALIIDDVDSLLIAQQHGFRCFTNVSDFKNYVREDVLGLEPIIH